MQAVFPKNNIQVPLYSGIGLIIVSMLFLGREVANGDASFLAQAAAILAAPAFFYLVGTIVYRKLDAPLAASGIVATGAWLIGVALIHLDGKRELLPDPFREYYWLSASLLSAALITLTGHKINSRLLLPLAPLAQINALWATLGAFGVSVAWIPPLSFSLVYMWWELPFIGKYIDKLWTNGYRGAAVLFTAFLLVFNLWLPAATGETRMAAWIAGALVVALIGLRHGWSRLAPLAIVMLAVAVAWGMPKALWSPLWLLLASATVVVIERAKAGDGKGAKITELSEALAISLSGIGAAFAALSPMFGAVMHPVAVVGVLAASGVLMVWLGWRRGLRMATHVGLWLTASAWGSFYFITVPESGTFGLWLALFASVALLTERILTSRQRVLGEKRKAPFSLVETVIRWPFADLVIGLSAIILLWTAWNIEAVSPMIITITLLLAIGIWIAAGMIYRLPVLLHIALWIAPLPFALLLMIAAPALWSMPLMGLEWQLLALIYLLVGHLSPRYHPPMLAPFFVAGYGLLGISLVLDLSSTVYAPISLGIVVLVCIATSAAVLLKRHPAWDVFAEHIAPYETRPYLNRHFNSLFLFLSGWFGAVWIQLMLGYTGMTLSRQGVFLVVFAGLFFLIGRTLSRMPNAAPLSLTSAGWLLWVIGLLQVFFSPPEAIITLILGTALSLEAFTRSRNTIWIPAIILNVFTAALEIAWMLSLPSHVLLLTLAILIALMGAWHERKSPRIGRIIALTCAPITLVITTLQPDTLSLTGMLALMFGFAVRYRQASLMYISYGLAGVLLTPLLPLHLPYAQIGIALLVESTVMAGAAIGIEVIVAREEIRWWTRSVFQLGMILIVFSFAFALVMPAYGLLAMGAGAPLVAIIPSLLIVAWCVLAYRQTGRALLLAASILPLLLICSLMLPTLPQTLTIGLVLFVVARRMNSPYFVLIEYAGVVSILLAAVAGMDFGQWDASENLLSVLYVVTLVCYGYVGGRRIPFAIGTGVFVVAGLFAVGKINGWFVPLIGGGVLIGAAVFMESQRAATEHITLMVRSRWQTWK